jgi:HYR domain
MNCPSLTTRVIHRVASQFGSLRHTPLLALVGLMFGAASANAAVQDLQWARTDAGNNNYYNYSAVNRLTTTPGGGTAVVGYYTGAPTFGVGDPTETTFDYAYNYDGFLARYDADGALEWAQPVMPSLGYYNYLGVYDVAASDDGSIAIAGYFTNAYWYYEQYYGYTGYNQDLEIFGQNGTSQTFESSDYQTVAFCAKFDAQGELLWVNWDPSIDYYHYCHSIEALPNGGYAVAGRYNNTIQLGDAPLHAIDLNGDNSSQVNDFVWAFAGDGSDLYSRSIAGGGFDVNIKSSPSGELILTGIYFANNEGPSSYNGGNGVGLDIGEANEFIAWEGYGYGTWLARLDTTGELSWARSIELPNSIYDPNTQYNFFQAVDISVDGAGGITLAGSASGMGFSELTLDAGLPNETTLYFDSVWSGQGWDYNCSCYVPRSYYYGSVMARFDAATGDLIWAKNVVSPVVSSNWENSIEINGTAAAGGKLVVSGAYSGEVVLDPTGSSPIELGRPNWNDRVIFIAEYDAVSGELESVNYIEPYNYCWFDSYGNEVCYSYGGYAYLAYRSTALADNGQVYVAGSANGWVTFGPGTDNETYLYGYYYDMFIAKFGAGGPSIASIEDITAQCDDYVNRTADVFFTVSIAGTIPANATLEVTEGGTTILLESALATAEVGFGPLVVPLGVTSLDVSLVSAGEVLLVETFDVTVQDTIAPVLAGVEISYTLECQAPSTQLFRSMLGISATDDCDSAPEITFSPAPLEMGTQTVIVTARDATGNTVTATTDITIVDTSPPRFTAFPIETIVKECTRAPGTEISFTVEAIDVCGAVVITCLDQDGNSVDQNGTTFALGDHIVTCTATDMVGNASSIEFSVRIEDNAAPVITVPGDISVANDLGECGAAVIFVVDGTDLCDPNLDVFVTADGAPVSSGDFFPVGTTTVTASAVDKSGNAASSSFNITVFDAEAPVLTAPSDHSLVTDCAGTDLSVSAADLLVSATDNCDLGLTIICSPSTLSPGTTLVTCEVTDVAGNMSSIGFPVTVMKGAFDYELLNPLDGTADNKIRSGRTVPVKLRVSCDNVFDPTVTATIDLIEDMVGDTVVANEVVDDSGLSNDQGSVMRLAGDMYIYNLKTSDWNQTKGARFRVTLRVAKPGHVDTICQFVLVNK